LPWNLLCRSSYRPSIHSAGIPSSAASPFCGSIILDAQ
jgi:hypothetical protein